MAHHFKKRACIVSAAAISLVISMYVYLNRESEMPYPVSVLNRPKEFPGQIPPVLELNPCGTTRKFVVITTINYPTDSVKKLASLKDWCVIVVGDAKTPRDWEWTNCVYLSLEKQNELGYRVLEHVPQNHYGRKNIGYLYAIQHGAEVIYETDDDNLLIGTEIQLIELGQTYLSLFPDSDRDPISKNEPWKGRREVCTHVVNIYEYFGHPSVWPRGIPFECIASTVIPPYGTPHNFTTNETQNGFVEEPFRIGVDQGLANGDPDLDAVFRLTRRPINTKIDINFNPNVPIVGIARGVFSPYNSQNTVYYRDAFWGLILPISTSSRVSDIWRGYITQRLMHDVGLRLAFRTATVTQYRNPHSYMSDFEQEQALYHDGGRMVDFLAHWDSSQSGVDIFSRMIQLQAELVQRDFLKEQDTGLLGAWVEDLARIGYHPPGIQGTADFSVPPLSQAPFRETKKKKMLAWILHFTYAPILDVVNLLVKYYAPHFQVIVIVSPSGRPLSLNHLESHGTEVIWSSSCRNKESMDNIPGGAMMRCYVRGLNLLVSNPKFNEIEYIVLSNDDVLLNMTKIQEFALESRPCSSPPTGDKHRAVTSPLMFSPPPKEINYYHGWPHAKRWPQCQIAFSKVPEVYKERFTGRYGTLALSGPADVFFLPPASLAEFIELGSIVSECWLEIALVNVLGMLTIPPSFPDYSTAWYIYSWSLPRPWKEDFPGYISSKSNVVAVHPFKLSFEEDRKAFINISHLFT